MPYLHNYRSMKATKLMCQSERLDIYHHHVNHLISTDKAYECFCTPDELLSIRVSLHQQGQRHTYDGRCRHLSEEERGRRKRAGHKHVVRFKVCHAVLFSLAGILDCIAQ